MTLSNPVSPSLSSLSLSPPSLPPLSTSLSPLSLRYSVSPPITRSPSLSLPLTDQQHRQQQSMKTKQTITKVFQENKVAQRRQ